eukprot:superscaffoldBa00001961_g12671
MFFLSTADPHVQYSAVSSFVFLRFFAVAVLSPHSFQLRSHHPDPEISRTLTLISKTIQTLGSWGSLSKKLSSFKETYMYDFFKSFQEDKCIEKVKQFLDEISSNVSKGSSGLEDAVVLKEGEVQKRGQGRKRLGKKNFKKRWLRVTNRELSYHKHKGKEALCVINVKNIQAVEKLDESAFNRKNVSLRHIVITSESVAPFTMLANLQLDIDCDRETERIFSLLSSNDTKLQNMEGQCLLMKYACASMAVYQGPQREQEEYSKFTIQEPKETFQTLKQLRNIMEELQRQHNIRSDTAAQYGSLDNPIVGKTS